MSITIIILLTSKIIIKVIIRNCYLKLKLSQYLLIIINAKTIHLFDSYRFYELFIQKINQTNKIKIYILKAYHLSLIK